MSPTQREALMLDIWRSMDIVDLMRVTGHDDGLDDERLVHVFGEDAPRLMTEGDKLRLKRQGREFMDITDHTSLGAFNAQRASLVYARPPVSALANSTRDRLHVVMNSLDDKHLRKDIEILSSFWNRNYRSLWGKRSSDWIFSHVQDILNSSSSKLVTGVFKFAHAFPQSSVIARLEAKDDDTRPMDKELVIIGAHLDSLNYEMPFYRAPGADDDGSGTVTILQVLRSLLDADFVPPKGIAVEFHWNAAEEGGLLGSQDIAATYEEGGARVKGMLQIDMTAFVKDGTKPIIALFDEGVDMILTSFATSLVEEYTDLPWNYTNCGPVCGSDHMSWTKAGYPAIAATEGLFWDLPLTEIHTPRDDLNVKGGEYSFKHMLEFVKLGVAFIAEVACAK
ncbi:Zn-dependent exopeptidase [Exidia glandulosa HHB12029]|uniref:Peptide hydrolase n=1 Tax=Exidia glandulosa HHB12029 TaxID=1314781 RepID=A0A165BGM0_EXIGL|nr:Zn-dependent exopeptidase [Exidia glandulosa HHB12029]